MSREVVGFPMSAQQRRLWQTGIGTYACAAAELRFEGPLSTDRLRSALAAAVTRHEILRTTLASAPGLIEPLQVVAIEGRFGWRETSSEAAVAEWLARADEAADVSDAGGEPAPWIDALLVRTGEDSGSLHLRSRTFVADLLGLAALLEEIAIGATTAGAVGSEEEPLQYVDFAAWQEEVVTSDETLEERAEWWRMELPPLVETAAPYRRPSSGGFSPRWTERRLHPTLGRALLGGTATGGDGRELLLGAWAALLARTTGRERIAVGVLFEGRFADSLKAVPAPLARYLPMIWSADLEITLEAAAADWRASLMEAGERQECYSWAGVAGGGLAPEGFLACAFEVAPPRRAIERNGVRFEIAPGRATIDRWEVLLRCRGGSDVLELELGYDASCVAGEDAERLLAEFEALLRSAAPGRPLGDLDILSEGDRSAIAKLCETATDLGVLATIPDGFSATAASAPDRIALSQGETHLSAAELSRRSVALARRLVAAGVLPESRVGICSERSPDQVIAMLAVLLAGAAWVPIDPAVPPDRLEFLLSDIEPLLLLLGPGAPGRLAARSDFWPLATTIAKAVDEEGGSLPHSIDPDAIAYVIYTSGSTGRPKGAALSHRAIANRLLWMQRTTPVGADDRVLMKTPFVFDASIWELFVPLLFGARLVLAPPTAHRDAAALVSAMVEEGVTILQVVPSMLSALLAEAGLSGASALRRLFSGGEALPLDLARRFQGRLGAELHNLYGPTECAIDVTHLGADEVAAFAGDTAALPIGRPIANVSTHVVDPRGWPVPPGVAGELRIGGANLARGYWRRPDLTAERFVPDPSGAFGARLYRTGDRARLRPDGALEFLGRADDQVKIRGVRVEPGEIEAMLRELPGVVEAAVVAPEDAALGRWLAAFYTAADSVLPEDLVRELALRLPEAMVPARLLRLPNLPRLAGGKLDRGALLDRAAGLRTRGKEKAPPLGVAEELLAGLFAELLGLESVGATDSFFDLGGHSLLATQAVSRIRDAFRVEIPLIQLFQTPSVRELGRWIDEALRTGEGEGAAEPIRPSAREGGEAPLSFAQQRLWFLAQLDPGSAAYNLALAFRVSGSFDQQAFSRSLTAIVERHEILRTTFPEENGVPVQRIAVPSEARAVRLDLSALPTGRIGAVSRGVVEETVGRPFDLAAGPLWRCLVVRHDPRTHTALLALHHIISDGWSSGILLHEIGVFYSAFAANAGGGAPSPLSPLPLQYADFAIWQRRHLTGDLLEKQVGYWREQLGGEIPALELPTDRARRATPTLLGSRRPVYWSQSFGATLLELARRSDTTLFMTLLAGLAALLARYSGQEDVIVGTPVANRTRLEIEGLVGFFVNTLALRVVAPLKEPFSALLRGAREVCLGAALHQDLPFERVIEEVAPARDLSRSPLFQVVLALQNTPQDRAEVGGVRLEPLPAAARAAKFDLTLDLVEARGEIRGAIEYAVDLFDPPTLYRLEGHLRRLLTAAAAAPDLPLGKLPLLADGERHQLLSEWNDTATVYGEAEVHLHLLITDRCADCPDSIALEFEDRQMSFAELALGVQALATGLAERGVQAGDVVGVLADRSLELLVALLGVMTAGGAYLPLDGALPAERLAAMIRQASPRLILADAGSKGRLPEEIVPVFCLADTVAWRSPLAGSQISAALGESALAYAIFTSGSTGQPKGAANTHGGIVNRLLWMQNHLTLDATDRVLQKTPCSFDVSVWELFWPLMIGARLVLARPGEHRDPAALAATIAERGVTTLHFVPSMLEVFLAEAESAMSPSLRRIVLSGEALSAPLARRCLEASEAELHNFYGPTEAAVDVTFWRCRADLLDRPVPIGRPIANLLTYVVDRELRPVPIGVAGELLLGGAGLARGYLANPGQTAERFVPAPVGESFGARVYRTGDRARLRPDGQIEFLGRLDFQVKIRGVRIEIGEIEGALLRYPAVREAVVVARPGADGLAQLIAYLTLTSTASSGPLDLRDLRSFLEGTLPEAMIPAFFVPLEAMPLNANGKVDRRALPEPGALALTGSRESLAPRNAIEAAIAAIWCEVLGRQSVGVEDDFFLLGGHSLLAAQVVARIRQTFRCELPLRRFFGASTIADLAIVLVANEPRQGQVARIAALLERIDRMSEEERQALVGSRGASMAESS